MALGVISNLFGNVAVAARSEPGGGGGEGARSGSGSSCGSEDALDIHVPSAHIDLSHTELDEGHFSQERSGSPISVTDDADEGGWATVDFDQRVVDALAQDSSDDSDSDDQPEAPEPEDEGGVAATAAQVWRTVLARDEPTVELAEKANAKERAETAWRKQRNAAKKSRRADERRLKHLQESPVTPPKAPNSGAVESAEKSAQAGEGELMEKERVWRESVMAAERIAWGKKRAARMRKEERSARREQYEVQSEKQKLRDECDQKIQKVEQQKDKELTKARDRLKEAERLRQCELQRAREDTARQLAQNELGAQEALLEMQNRLREEHKRGMDKMRSSIRNKVKEHVAEVRKEVAQDMLSHGGVASEAMVVCLVTEAIRHAAGRGADDAVKALHDVRLQDVHTSLSVVGGFQDGFYWKKSLRHRHGSLRSFLSARPALFKVEPRVDENAPVVAGAASEYCVSLVVP